MSRVTIFLILRLALSSLTIISVVTASCSFAYADGDSDGDDGDDGDDSGDDDGDSDDSDSGKSSDESENEDDDASNASNAGAQPDTDHEETDRSVRGGFWQKFFGGRSKKSHQSSIRKAVQKKQILPLGKIMRIFKRKISSEIIGIELERKNRAWVYEFKVIDSRGRLKKVYVDATNGSLLNSKTEGNGGINAPIIR